ncbi:MAG: hypothetical protein LC109_09475 [Bacteroidia bacterium]|nr:hypothetical protein [Bacteroidia bacterium]TXH60728.1 MAG: hypothetical protein E6Q89_00400 [Bacteroidia bacterium]
MKINFVQTIIAIAVSLLIAYGLYSFHDSENKILLSAGSFVFLATALVMTIGASFELPRTTTNIRVVSGIFFAVALASNIIFSFVTFSVPLYIIANGILILIFLLIIYSISNAKQ